MLDLSPHIFHFFNRQLFNIRVHLIIHFGASNQLTGCIATEGLFQRAIIQSAPLGISRGRARMYAKMSQQAPTVNDDAPLDEILRLQTQVAESVRGFGLKAAMPFGTQYGHYPLSSEAETDADWRRA